MIKPELVRARRSGGELHLIALAGAAQREAVELADTLLAVAREGVGAAREEVAAALAAVPVAARFHKVKVALVKLIGDLSEYAEESPVEPREARRRVFLAASAARRSVVEGVGFSRDTVLAGVARELGVEPEALDTALYADLRGSHLLRAIAPITGEGLIERYRRAQVQAVLLRAVSIQVEVECASPGAYRELFHKLKFRRLLHRITPLPEGGFRIDIDGPYSLFESVTKYGLQLALILPALEACDRFSLSADLRWGKRREKLGFRLAHTRRGEGAADPARLHDDVAALIQAFEGRPAGWRAAPADAILDLPGVGLSVPDLLFTHPAKAHPIYFELLGYWSRAAVWRRVELVQAGLPHRILFAVSSRLRVSEEVLPEDESGALYVFKQKMSAAAIERKLAALAR